MSFQTYLPYKGEQYRDERMFVLNITQGKLEIYKKDNKEIKDKFFVNTYRNTFYLPLSRERYFDSIEEAEEFVKQTEPFIPLITNDEFPLSTPEGESTWEYWLSWLNHKEFYSAISGYQNLPYNQSIEGGNFEIKNYYNSVHYEEDSMENE